MSSISLADTRFVLADDHAVVRMGFRLLLEGAGATVVAEADNGQAAFAAYDEHAPDALIMDVSMPGGSGLEGLERLMSHHPNARVLMLSAHEDSQIPVRALKAGATGYLSKSAHPDEFLRAAQSVSRGKKYVDPNWRPTWRWPNSMATPTRCRNSPTRSSPFSSSWHRVNR